MAKKIIQMYDKYQSTTKVYPKIIGECLTEDALDKIKGEVESKYEITQVVVEDSEPVGFSIKDNDNNVTYNIPVSNGGDSQKVIKVYHGVINQVPDEDIYYISQSAIEDNVVDLTTGQPPTSYNKGDIIIEVNWNDEYNYVENMYVFLQIDDGTFATSGDLVLTDCNYINNGVKSKQLYQHNIKIDTGSTFRATILLISDSETPLDYSTLKSYLQNKGFTTANYLLNAIGFYYDNNVYYTIFGVCTQNNEIRFLGAKDNNLSGFNITNSYNIYDNVVAL